MTIAGTRPGIRARRSDVGRLEGAAGEAEQGAVGAAAHVELGPIAVLVEDVAGPAQRVLAGELAGDGGHVDGRAGAQHRLAASQPVGLGEGAADPVGEDLRPGVDRGLGVVRVIGAEVGRGVEVGGHVGRCRGTAALVVAASADPISSSFVERFQP